MPFEQTRDLIDHARAFHRTLAASLQSVSDSSNKERVRLLLASLRGHQEHLERILADYELGASQVVLDTWFRSPPGLPRPECDPQLALDPDWGIGDLTLAIGKLYGCLLALYREGADRADTPAASEALANLAQRMEEEVRLLTREICSADDV